MQLVINTFGASPRKQGDRFLVKAGDKQFAVSARKVQERKGDTALFAQKRAASPFHPFFILFLSPVSLPGLRATDDTAADAGRAVGRAAACRNCLTGCHHDARTLTKSSNEGTTPVLPCGPDPASRPCCFGTGAEPITRSGFSIRLPKARHAGPPGYMNRGPAL
jgi:hypothetical protein